MRYNPPMSSNNTKVAVGLSGGVDSAVSAYLLKSHGYEVIGAHMQCWDYSSETCKGNEDRSDAVAVCGQLGIKFRFLNFEKEYKDRVIDYFYSEYRLGRTPNPDVLCNKEIKFGLFLEWAMREGFDYIATGHYARISRVDKDQPLQLLKGVDESKDQSYFLYRIKPSELKKTLFPIGNYTKKQVREIAKKNKFPNYNKKSTVGICFIGKVNLKEMPCQGQGKTSLFLYLSLRSLYLL